MQGCTQKSINDPYLTLQVKKDDPIEFRYSQVSDRLGSQMRHLLQVHTGYHLQLLPCRFFFASTRNFELRLGQQQGASAKGVKGATFLVGLRMLLYLLSGGYEGRIDTLAFDTESLAFWIVSTTEDGGVAPTWLILNEDSTSILDLWGTNPGADMRGFVLFRVFSRKYGLRR